MAGVVPTLNPLVEGTSLTPVQGNMPVFIFWLTLEVVALLQCDYAGSAGVGPSHPSQTEPSPIAPPASTSHSLID